MQIRNPYGNQAFSTSWIILPAVLVVLFLALCIEPVQAQRKKKDDPYHQRLEAIKADLKNEETNKKKVQKEAAKQAKKRIKEAGKSQETSNATSSKFKSSSVKGSANKAAKKSAEKQAVQEMDEEIHKSKQAERQAERKKALEARNERLKSDPQFEDLMDLVAQKKEEAVKEKDEEKRQEKIRRAEAAKEKADRKRLAEERKSATDRMEIAEAFSNAQARAGREEQQKKIRDALAKHLSELAQKYPDGITQEVVEEKDRTIINRIKVKGKKAIEYQKIIHHWGGIYFFRNGLSIPEFAWDKETQI